MTGVLFRMCVQSAPSTAQLTRSHIPSEILNINRSCPKHYFSIREEGLESYSPRLNPTVRPLKPCSPNGFGFSFRCEE